MAEDWSGLPWAFIADAQDPDCLVPGMYLLVGAGSIRAVAMVMDVTDGIVHVQPLCGQVAEHAHLLAPGQKRVTQGP